MAPFRVVARQRDKGHHDHAWAQVGGPIDYEDDARAFAEQTAPDVAPASPDPGEPVRPDPARLVGELVGQGYELKIQELVDNGDTSKWKDV